MKSVLVLCTGNSCRSVLAEALINQIGSGRYMAVSAGSKPAGYIHPKSIETLERHNINVGNPRSVSRQSILDKSVTKIREYFCSYCCI